MQEDARVALANKLRSKRTEEIPAQPAPQPAAPGPKDPFKGAKSPVVVTDPHWAPRTPHKRIVAPEDMDRFQASPAFAEILGMLRALNDGAQDRSLTDDVEESEVRRPPSDAAGPNHSRDPCTRGPDCEGDATEQHSGIHVAFRQP